MRRVATLVAVAVVVAVGGLYWLHDGDLAAAGREVAAAAGQDPSALVGIPDAPPSKITVAPDRGQTTEDPPTP